jgi:methionine-rich copper-binding protein CopC
MQRLLNAAARALPALAVLLLLSALLAGGASAHARLTASTPADGATLSAEPTTVTATFGEETSLTKSRLTVSFTPAAGGAAVVADTGDGHVDVNARTNMSVTLKPGLGAGVYTVTWHTLTEDDNGAADGAFTFTVTGGGAGPGTTSGGAAPGATNGGATPGATSGAPLPTTGAPSASLPLAGLLAALALLGGLRLRALGRQS